jgi:hypothetical protein
MGLDSKSGDGTENKDHRKDEYSPEIIDFSAMKSHEQSPIPS